MSKYRINPDNDLEVRRALAAIVTDMDDQEAFDLLERLDPDNDVVLAIYDQERKDLEDLEREYTRSRGV